MKTYQSDEEARAQQEIRDRIYSWEEKHGKKVANLPHEETVEACQDIMCLTRREAEEYMAYLSTSLL